MKIVLLLILLSGNALANDFEEPIYYKMEEVIPRKLQASKEYRIGKMIGHNGYFYLIDVYSIFGNYSVVGLASLENLAFELKVLSQLQELESSQVFIDAAAKAGVNVVFAPLKTIGNLLDAAANPDKTWETIKKVPDGVIGIFDWVSNRLDSASDEVKDSFANKSAEERADADSLVVKGAKGIEKYSLDYLGYNKIRRAWCEKTSVDPFTDNEPLKDRIARLAEVETAVKVGFKFVPGLPVDLGVAGKINSYMEKTKKVSLYADPSVANDKNKVLLMEMGIPEEEAKKFIRNKKFSSTMKTLLVAQLDEMTEVENKISLLNVAAEITSKEGALYLVRSAKYLRQLQSRGTKFARFLSGAHVIAAVTSNGELIVPLALDRIIWTKAIAETVNDTIVKSKVDSSIRKIRVITSAKLSERMKAELKERKILFDEAVDMAL